MHIYAFGSICRGEIDIDSDIDLLAIVGEYDSRLNPKVFSIYLRQRITELWEAGNPFAWHLALESRLIFSADGTDFLKSLGGPQPYRDGFQDCTRFYELFQQARQSLCNETSNVTFELSNVFLALRNIAICYSLSGLAAPDFSRNAAERLESRSVPISGLTHRILERARLLSSRGLGVSLNAQEMETALQSLDFIDSWMSKLVKEVKQNVRI